jgi:hypothetical protein
VDARSRPMLGVGVGVVAAAATAAPLHLWVRAPAFQLEWWLLLAGMGLVAAQLVALVLVAGACAVLALGVRTVGSRRPAPMQDAGDDAEGEHAPMQAGTLGLPPLAGSAAGAGGQLPPLMAPPSWR